MAFLVFLAFASCSANVVDQINREDDASSFSDKGLDNGFGGSSAHLSALAEKNDGSSQVLSRQKRFIPFRFRWVVRQSNGNDGYGNGKHAKQK